MRPHADISRSLTSMTVGLQQRLRANQDLKRLWGFGEREQQFQFPFQGQIGVVPVETTFKIVFDHIFAGDPGYARDSQLGEPVARFGFRLDSAPPGTIPYAHVSSWIQDDDFNYTGANVTVGAHNPASLNSGQTYTEPFGGLIHCTFQGYGCAIDNPGDILAGADDASGGGPRGVDALPQFSGGGDGNLGGTSGSTSATGGDGTGITVPVGGGGGKTPGSSGGTSSGSGGPTSLGGGGPHSPGPGTGSTGTGSGSGGDPWYSPKYHRMPKYPSGPLGGFNPWTRVATWEPHGSLGAWDIPNQEGALRVADDTDGRLTCKTVYEVTRGSAIAYSPTNPNPPTVWNPPPGARWVEPTPDKGSWIWYLGDKYAARWTTPGRVADGHKIRLHFLSNPTGNDFYDLIQSVVVNMRDRSTGLAFWWGANGAGWTTDLRQLGLGPHDDLTPGRKPFTAFDRLIVTRDSEFTIPHDMGATQQGQVESSQATIDSYDLANPPLNRYTPEQEFAQYSLGIPNEVWVEVWRDGRTIHAAVYKNAPENGATPSYMSDYQLRADDPNFGPNIGGYFGWTMSYMIDGKNAPNSPYFLSGAHSWPYDTPIRGIKEAMLFKRG